MDNLENILEGLLFVAGDGIEKGYIMEKLGVTDKELTKAIEKLKEKYNEDSGIHIITYKDKVQMSSNPKYADDISLVLNPIRERNLSKATLETVAIIAYKQPVTRLEIENIRGVNSDYALQTLMNLKMIEVVGRKDAIGKPLLFGTTEEFLKRFDLENLNQLPDYEDLLKSIAVIEEENNHLYNEFDIPEESTEENKEITENSENNDNLDNKDNLQKNTNNNTNETNNISIEENNIEKDLVKEEINENAKIDTTNNEELEEEIPDFLKNEKDLQKID